MLAANVAIVCFFFNDTAPTEIYTLSLHDALPIYGGGHQRRQHEHGAGKAVAERMLSRSEEHTSELQSLRHLVCRLLLEKKKKSDAEVPVTITEIAMSGRGKTHKAHTSVGVARTEL